MGVANVMCRRFDLLLDTSPNEAVEALSEACEYYLQERYDLGVAHIRRRAAIVAAYGLPTLLSINYSDALSDAFRIYRTWRNLPGVANAIRTKADIALLSGNLATALRFYGNAERIFKRAGDISAKSEVSNRLAYLRTSVPGEFYGQSSATIHAQADVESVWVFRRTNDSLDG
jgi:hypothetical protein